MAAVKPPQRRAILAPRGEAQRPDAAHPDLVPYAELNEETREKDRVMIRARTEVLALASQRIAYGRAG